MTIANQRKKPSNFARFFTVLFKGRRVKQFKKGIFHFNKWTKDFPIPKEILLF